MTEDYPHIALYLRSITGEAQPLVVTQTETSETTQPDLDTPTSDLLLQVKEIMEASERGELSSIEVDEKLREIVESVVSGTVQVGREIGESELDENGNYTSGTRDREPRDQGLEEVKRRREDAGR